LGNLLGYLRLVKLFISYPIPLHIFSDKYFTIIMVGEVNQNPVLTALTAEIREHAALTSAIKSGKKCDSTKEQYKRKQIHFEDWIENKRPALIDTEKWLVNIDAATMEDFMGHICQKKDKFGEYFTPPKFQSYDHVNGYKSAILDMYEIQNVKPTTAIKDMFNDFAKGYKRKIASLKQQGEIKITEGKAPLTFQGYRFLSKKAVEQKTDFTWAIFAWMFLLFCWNLMARCVSVSGIMFDHIGWEGDAMTIIFPKHKGDQEGEHSAPKHVYANPRNPEICPILAFAVFIWTIGFRRDGAKRTLFGDTKHTEERFSAWLRKMLGSAAEDLILMGIAIIEIGTHSFRKGIASFLACLTGGPSAIAIYLRAGWSLGAVTARYIIEGGGGDQLCGRAATGICIMEASFADLPPHFNLSDGPVLTVEEWEEILPNLKLIWDLWWCGNPAKQYAPYRHLKGFDLNNKQDRVNLSKVNKIMKVLTMNYDSTAEICRMSIQNRDATFARLFMDLFLRLFPEQAGDDFDARRFGDQSYLTIYNYVNNEG